MEGGRCGEVAHLCDEGAIRRADEIKWLVAERGEDGGRIVVQHPPR